MDYCYFSTTAGTVVMSSVTTARKVGLLSLPMRMLLKSVSATDAWYALLIVP